MQLLSARVYYLYFVQDLEVPSTLVELHCVPFAYGPAKLADVRANS